MVFRRLFGLNLVSRGRREAVSPVTQYGVTRGSGVAGLAARRPPAVDQGQAHTLAGRVGKNESLRLGNTDGFGKRGVLDYMFFIIIIASFFV